MLALAALSCGLLFPSVGQASDDALAALRVRAHDLAYNLSYDRAVIVMDEAVARYPEDPGVHRSLATILWLQILFERGSVTVDDYLGPLSKQNVAFRPPPAPLAARFKEHAARARDLAKGRLAARPGDVDALYELGAAEGLLASYTATVEGRVFAAFREARRALDAHKRVLRLEPRRSEAGLVVGTYSYVVANLTWAVRLIAPLFGFRGDREGGLRLIEGSAAPGSEAEVEAKFALLLFYNRERRFADALRIIGELQTRFPQNRLLWLEAGATALRAERPEDALRELDVGLAKLEADTRPRIRGELALWRYKRGAARVALGRREAALADLKAALDGDARDWVRGRARIELARLALQQGDKAAARRELTLAASLCGGDNDPIGEREARDVLRTLPR